MTDTSDFQSSDAFARHRAVFGSIAAKQADMPKVDHNGKPVPDETESAQQAARDAAAAGHGAGVPPLAAGGEAPGMAGRRNLPAQPETPANRTTTYTSTGVETS